jgi:glycosyltransferase involved in cell wall biosynthesis
MMLSTLCFPRTIGGVENHIYNLSKALIKLGHYVEIIIPVIEKAKTGKIVKKEFEGLITYEMYIEGIPLIIKNLRSQFSGRSSLGMLLAFANKASFQIVTHYIAKQILGLMRENNMDVLHQHDFSANIFSTKIISKYYPVILTNHTGEFLYLKKYKFLNSLLIYLTNHYRKIIGPSEELAEIPNYKKNNFSYIPNGVDTEFYNPIDSKSKNELYNQLEIESGKYVILCPRRWAPTKGVIVLVEAMEKIINSTPNVCFLFAGSDYEGYPNYRKDIFDKLKTYKDSNYKLLGNLNASQLKKYYQISDVVVIPSLMEATSLAALEAMACACPVVATNVGGMPDLINNENGILVNPNDPTDLAEALIKLWSSNKKEEMGRQARKFVVDNYEWLKIAQKTLNIYESIMK